MDKGWDSVTRILDEQERIESCETVNNLIAAFALAGKGRYYLYETTFETEILDGAEIVYHVDFLFQLGTAALF